LAVQGYHRFSPVITNRPSAACRKEKALELTPGAHQRLQISFVRPKATASVASGAGKLGREMICW